MTATTTPIDPATEAADAGHTGYAERAYAAGREFLGRVDTILDVIRGNRVRNESEGTVSKESVEAMEWAGFFRALTPARYGGLEMDPVSFYDGIMRVGGCDPSAAWIGGQLNVHSFEMALLDRRMQEEFWSTGPDTRASSSYAPTGNWTEVDGGYRVSGTWGFSSGVDHASWVFVGGSDRNFVVPLSDCTVDHDSWHVAGLKGTGSKSVTLEDVFVPAYRVHSLYDTYRGTNPGWEVNDGPLYRLSFSELLTSTMTNSAIGAALGGLQAYIEESKHRRARRGTGVAVTENPHLMVRLASAFSTVQTMRDRHLRNWQGLFEIALEGRMATAPERLKVRFEAADAIASCLDAIYEIWPVAGAGVIMEANPLQQVIRDLLAMRVHGSAGVDAAAGMYSSALMGLPGPSFEDNPTMRTLAYYA